MENVQIEALHELIDRNPESRFLALAQSQLAVRDENVGEPIHRHTLDFGQFVLFQNHAEKKRSVLKGNFLGGKRERKGYAIHNAEKNQSLDSFAAKSGNGGLEIGFDDLLEERVECRLMKRVG